MINTKENYDKPFRGILMGLCSCSKFEQEFSFVRNEGEVDIRKCMDCGEEKEWKAYIMVPPSQNEFVITNN